MSKTHLLLTTAVSLAFAVAGHAAPLGKKHAPPAAKPAGSANFAKAPFRLSKAQQPHAARSGKLKQKFLIETWAASTSAIPPGYVRLDPPHGFVCDKTCTIVTNHVAQLFSYYSYSQVGICPIVDGYFTNGSCYFSGSIDAIGHFANRTNQTNMEIGAGTHAVQTYLYTFTPAYLGHYQNDYVVYE
ncbi:MAG TPA: hypothetical protein VG819_13510 [Rhizomicrobium sp.]|nr:hypothetical protein [Rhizomicrobium sp.]